MNVQVFWSRKGFFNFLLLPLSLLFGIAAAVRRWFYENGLLKSIHPGVPVIIVGNLTAGGSGKTPFVIWLVNWLKWQGFHPGVVSRGYARKNNEMHVLDASSSAAISGDEPLLVFEKTAVPVVVGADRPRACKALLEQHPQVDVLISDDGLQHYALARDLELVLADPGTLFGNGWLMPAGPLREMPGRMNQADALILSGGEGKLEFKPVIPVFHVTRQQGVFLNIKDGRIVDAQYFAGREVYAVAGIARPEAFFSALEEAGLSIHRLAFRDHHAFRPEDIDSAATVVMTEKDAVKCRQFAGADWWVQTLELLPGPRLGNWLVARLAQLTGKHQMDNKLLEILVCPVCKGSLHYDRPAQELKCSPCRLAYPIKEGIPVMLPEEARALDAQEEVGK